MTWLPFVGDVFAIALGFYRLNPWKCTLYMFIGKAARFVIWTLLILQHSPVAFSSDVPLVSKINSDK